MNLLEILSQKTFLLAGILPLVSAKHANFTHYDIAAEIIENIL